MQAKVTIEQKGKIVRVIINDDVESKVCTSKKEAKELYNRLCGVYGNTENNNKLKENHK